MKKLIVILTLISTLAIGACSGGTGNNAATPVKSSDPCIAASSKWALWTGATCLRGANIFQTAVVASYGGMYGNGPFGPPYTQADLDNLAALGANYINLSVAGLYTENPPYVLDTNAQAMLDDLLTKAQKADLFVVITFRTGPGRNEIVFQAATTETVWNSQAAQDEWVAMWQYVAGRYKDNPIVVGYDLMVEPNANNCEFQPNTLDTPSQFYPAYANTLKDWNPLAARITKAIRQVDANTPILVGGMDFSQVYWLDSIVSTGDAKTVYTVHQYEPTTYTHQKTPTNTYGTSGNYTFTKSNLSTYLSYVSTFKTARGVPVASNEFGLRRWQPNADQYLNDSMDLFEANNLNYAVWIWEASYAGVDWDGFDYRKGQNQANQSDTLPNPLITAFKNHFAKNTVRPSNRGF